VRKPRAQKAVDHVVSVDGIPEHVLVVGPDLQKLLRFCSEGSIQPNVLRPLEHRLEVGSVRNSVDVDPPRMHLLLLVQPVSPQREENAQEPRDHHL